MPNIDAFESQLERIERDIADADGEVTVTFTGPDPSGAGQSVNGQLLVDIWNNEAEDADVYFVELQRDPADDPDEFLLAVATRFVTWLREHGVDVDEHLDGVRLPVGDQLVMSATIPLE